jgi:type VI secretion system protein ImpE
VTLQASIDRGQIDEAVALVENALRGDPASQELRWQFFQLHCITGQWKRALGQLKTLAGLDPEFLLRAQGLRHAIQCEALRAEVFGGRQSPVVLGEPPDWFGGLALALRAGAEGRYDEAVRLRETALQTVSPVSAQIDGKSYAGLEDADCRLGPVLEAVVEGNYYWVPLERLRRIEVQAPGKLIDVVWLRLHLTWTTGGESHALVATRYPGSEAASDPWVRLARVAEWEEKAPGLYWGTGVRTLFAGGEYVPLVSVREIVIEQVEGDR